MRNLSHEKLTGWLIPALLAAALAVLGWITTNLNRISESQAVTLYRLETVEKKIDSLEHK